MKVFPYFVPSLQVGEKVCVPLAALFLSNGLEEAKEAIGG